MAFSSSSELLAWLSQNLFLNPQQVGDLQPFVAQNPDLHPLCKELLRRDWLTAYQVNQILKTGGESLVIGANRLHSRLGEGAMGQVYRAWNIRLGRVVAVKMLHPDHTLSGKAMDRFRREMQTAGSLDHPNIVLLRDADETNRVPFLVMDYFDGIDLSRKTKQEGPQPILETAEWIRQASLGLQHAHERGVVHRDIKPSNLLLVRLADGSPVIKILDFGLAKFAREEEGQQPLTQAGRLIGTVDFIAPEQAQDARVADCRADIYSLGCTMFYLLTNKAPFPGNDQMEKLTARINNEPTPVRVHRPEVSPGLEQVLLKMMARRPEHRYQTPLEVAYALAPFCVPNGVPATHPGGLVATPTPIAAPAMAVAASIPAAAPAMARPVTASPVMAMPVMALDEMPEAVAVPEAMDLVETAIAVDDSPEPPLGDSSFGEPASAAASAAYADEPRAKSRGLLWLVIGMVAAVVLLGGGVAGFMMMRPANAVVAPALGTMTLELDNPPDRVWAWGERKPIVVKVTRHNFAGQVALSLDRPPPWARMTHTVPVLAAKAQGEVTVLITFDGFEGADKLRITATSPNSQPATVEYPIEIVQVRPAAKTKLPKAAEEQ